MNSSQLNQLPDSSGIDTPAVPKANQTEQLSQLAVIVAHEDRNAIQQLKDIFEAAEFSLQIHKVTSLEDLIGSLQIQDWDIICSFSHSNEFDPKKVCAMTATHGNGASTIYIHTNNDEITCDTLLGYGYKDHLSDKEPAKIYHSIVRETIAARNARLVNSNLNLIEEYGRKNSLLLDASTESIVYIADGMIMHGNQAFVDLLCFDSLDDLVWQSFIDYVSDDEQSAFKSALKAFRKDSDNSNNVDVALVSEDGTAIEANISFASATHEGEHCTQLVIHEKKEEVKQASKSSQAENGPSFDQHNDSEGVSYQEGSDNHQQSLISHQAGIVITEDEINKFSQTVEAASNKGHVLYAHFNFDNLYKGLNTLTEYSTALAELSSDTLGIKEGTFTALIPVSNGDWLIATDDANTPDIKAVADQLQSHLLKTLTNEKLSSANVQLLCVGAAPYGVADITAYEAVTKAYEICGTTALTGGSFAEYQPRISDSSSSEALISALELERLKIKFQPIIALQGQPQHLYEASLFLVQDDNLERSAHHEMRSLGVEVENTKVDKWFFNSVLETLLGAVANDENICVNIPISASAIVHKDFFPDIMMTFEKSGLAKSCVSFSANVDVAKDYPEKTIKLFSLLRQAGFNTALENVNEDHLQLLSSIKPCYANLDPSVSSDKSNNSWRAKIRTIFDAAKPAGAQCIVGDITSAAELAKIWQCGAPFIKGSYLQEPMTTLDYEFSELD